MQNVMPSNSCLCTQCNTVLHNKHFYKSSFGLYSKLGYIPICKECLNSLFDTYTELYRDNRKAMQRICMAFDLYYSDAIFNNCIESEKVAVGQYVRRLNIVQYRGKTFDTSISEGFTFGSEEYKPIILESDNDVIEEPIRHEEEQKQIEPEQEEPKQKEYTNDVDDYNNSFEVEVTIDSYGEKIKQADIDRWGFGFDKADYDTLNNHYNQIKNANPNCDNNQEIFITDLCYTKMQQMKALRGGRVDDFNKLTESYRKSFQQAGLKAKADDEKANDDAWSEWTYNISQYTPEEYYKDKKLYEDYDYLDEYIKRHIGRPISNIEHDTSERDYEYYVHDDGDAYEI